MSSHRGENRDGDGRVVEDIIVLYMTLHNEDKCRTRMSESCETATLAGD